MNVLLIYIVIPLAGIAAYARIRRRLRRTEEGKELLLPLFLLFFTYGGLLLTILSGLSGLWSGLASLGLFYLALVAPFVMGAVAYGLRKRRKNTGCCRYLFRCALAYFFVMPIALFLTIMIIE